LLPLRGLLSEIWPVETEAIRSSETLLAIYKTSRRHNPEDHNRHHPHENLTYQMKVYSKLRLFCRTVHGLKIGPAQL
jgi:hypothetical protein